MYNTNLQVAKWHIREKFNSLFDYYNEENGTLKLLTKKSMHFVTAYYRKKCIVITAYEPTRAQWKNNYKIKK